MEPNRGGKTANEVTGFSKKLFKKSVAYVDCATKQVNKVIWSASTLSNAHSVNKQDCWYMSDRKIMRRLDRNKYYCAVCHRNCLQ